MLANTACAVGNSSSFVRDAGYFGTPVVLVGNRQNGRETDEHVTRVPVDKEAIAAAIKKQLDHGRYAAEHAVRRRPRRGANRRSNREAECRICKSNWRSPSKIDGTHISC